MLSREASRSSSRLRQGPSASSQRSTKAFFGRFKMSSGSLSESMRRTRSLVLRPARGTGWGGDWRVPRAGGPRRASEPRGRVTSTRDRPSGVPLQRGRGAGPRTWPVGRDRKCLLQEKTSDRLPPRGWRAPSYARQSLRADTHHARLDSDVVLAGWNPPRAPREVRRGQVLSGRRQALGHSREQRFRCSGNRGQFVGKVGGVASKVFIGSITGKCDLNPRDAICSESIHMGSCHR